MDHLDVIRKLLAAGAEVNARAKDSTETRTIFTMQWLYEDGATAFLRASQSGDVELMKLLLEHGADPKIATANHTTALAVAAGIGWVEGVTYEHSAQDSLEAVRLLLDLGVDPNVVDGDGRAALHGAAHKGRNDVVQLLVDHGARLDVRDLGSRDTGIGALQGHGWLPVDYAERPRAGRGAVSHSTSRDGSAHSDVDEGAEPRDSRLDQRVGVHHGDLQIDNSQHRHLTLPNFQKGDRSRSSGVGRASDVGSWELATRSQSSLGLKSNSSRGNRSVLKSVSADRLKSGL